EPAAGADDCAASAAPAAGAPTPRIKSPRLRASPGKPVAPIAIGYELSTQPLLGVPFDVRICARGGGGIADLALTVHPGDGVQAGTPQLTASSADGVERSWTVAATAFDEGALYLSVLVQGAAGGEHAARNLLIPIRIGTVAPAKQAAALQPATDSSGRRVIVLP